MKIVVLGASGLVGSHFMSAAVARGHCVVGSTRSADSRQLRQLELGDQDATRRFLEEEEPAAVIYAAGWTWVDGCEADTSRSRRENFELPLGVAAWCQASKVRFLNYSSSYVFGGEEGGYVETDPVAPKNAYGRHKADAENAILDVSGGQALIPRLICVWGAEAARKNFAYQVMDSARAGKPMRLPADQSGNPTWAGDVACWSLALLEAAASGIWHLAGDRPEMNRVEWAKDILSGLSARGMSLRPALTPVSTASLAQPAQRPLKAGMSCRKIQAFMPRTCRAPSDLPEIVVSASGVPEFKP